MQLHNNLDFLTPNQPVDNQYMYKIYDGTYYYIDYREFKSNELRPNTTQVFDYSRDLKIIKKTKNLVLFTLEHVNGEVKNYWYNKKNNVLGQYTKLDNGKNWYSYTLDVTVRAQKELVKYLFSI